MKHIFISHAGRDSAVAKQLFEELRNVGHDVRIDLHELQLGDDTISFMNEAIANAQTVIILFSKDTPQAKWQTLEINAAVWNETEQEGGKVIVLKLDDSDLPPLLGPKMYGSLKPEAYQQTLQKLCKDITSGNRKPLSCVKLSEKGRPIHFGECVLNTSRKCQHCLPMRSLPRTPQRSVSSKR